MRVFRAPWFWLILVVVLGLVFYATWQSIEQGQRATMWSYSHLFQEADAGRISSVEIHGQTALVTGKDGGKHTVTLSPDERGDAQRLEQDGVDVVFRPNAGGAYWLQVLIPNLILLLLIGGFLFWLIRRSRT